MDTVDQNKYLASQRSTLVKDSKLETFFINELRDIYEAENKIVDALPKMHDAAFSPKLEQTFDEHLQLTYGHIARLEKVFERLGIEVGLNECEAMEGIIEECDSIIDKTEKNTATRDVGLIMAAQKIEHYEIASYSTLVQLARTLGHDDVVELLKTTLNEEMETDRLLTDIAESDINYLIDDDSEEDVRDDNYSAYNVFSASYPASEEPYSFQEIYSATFDNPQSAEKAYVALGNYGYTQDDVNIAMSDFTRDRFFSKDDQTDLGETFVATATGSAIGSTLGAFIGAVAAIGSSLLIPGMGLVISGPVAGALAGAGAGGFTGGLAGALVAWGLPKSQAKEYEESIKKGQIVLGVHPKNDQDFSFIDQIWRSNGGSIVIY